jgi:hypothetical protein
MNQALYAHMNNKRKMKKKMVWYIFSFFPRAPSIHTEQGQNMLEILQNCFEEKSKALFLGEL